MDLNIVPGEATSVRYHQLGLRIVERIWRWVIGVLNQVGFDPPLTFLVTSVPGKIEDLPLQNKRFDEILRLEN